MKFKRKKKTKNRIKTITKLASTFVLLSVVLLLSEAFPGLFTGVFPSASTSAAEDILLQVPEYTGEPYAEIDGNIPSFSSEMMNTESRESYSKLDLLGRCGVAFANIGRDLMPTDERQSIGMIKPSGWHTVRYDDLIEGKYLYNICSHFIMFKI